MSHSETGVAKFVASRASQTGPGAYALVAFVAGARGQKASVAFPWAPWAWEGAAAAGLDVAGAPALCVPFVTLGRGVGAALSGAPCPADEMAANGWGFGMAWRRFPRLPTRGCSSSDRGVGRACWFLFSGDVTRALARVRAAQPERLPDLGYGIGFAAALVGEDPTLPDERIAEGWYAGRSVRTNFV